ncbi:DUF871 domain-containing protein [Paenibacillus hemerocallicola]|uniref:DUF871 domain-containing protein n=1 Tax=Paenibacillus hemerocallicola TaxID=1172614 RepID=A0A5C4TCR2_9BACL|nr:MupG family TIM beta-alpha barrel fold protein [Paenibacillus hemerocallicola]TNJ66287.1 DUF871 domain-containing protein [Paenibacillus hemerocallicola]
MLGISVYTNDEFSLESNLAYVETAAKLGYRRVFTSLHLPEVDFRTKWAEMERLCRRVNELGMEMTADISPTTMKVAGASVHDLSPFRRLGLAALRIDYGFPYEEIAAMSGNEHGLELVLNASTISMAQLAELKARHTDFSRMSACHNFYPRAYTGLTANQAANQARIVSEYGLKLSAFVPSLQGRRGPIHEGLPTIEKHRTMSPSVSAQFLLHSGLADAVYFGDAYASDDELGQLIGIDPEIIELGIVPEDGISDEERSILFSGVHTNRPDAPDYVIRSSGSRRFATVGAPLAADRCKERSKYSVTIDNAGYKRYSGELQICLTDIPQDARVNVVGTVWGDSRELVELITGGKKFAFKIYR